MAEARLGAGTGTALCVGAVLGPGALTLASSVPRARAGPAGGSATEAVRRRAHPAAARPWTSSTASAESVITTDTFLVPRERSSVMGRICHLRMLAGRPEASGDAEAVRQPVRDIIHPTTPPR